MSEEEQRMKFSIKLEDGSGDLLKKLHMVYGNGALKATSVYKWAARYKEGQKLLEVNPYSGTHLSTYNNESVKHIDKLLATNQRISNRYMTETLGINIKTVQLIIVEDLHM